MTLISRKDQRQLDRERKQIQRERRKRLEKAAPDLLAACKQLIKGASYDDHIDAVPDKTGWTKYNWVTREDLMAIESAIALAETKGD